MAERTYKRATLEKRLEKLAESLHKEKPCPHGVIDDTGWGARDAHRPSAVRRSWKRKSGMSNSLSPGAARKP